ncbi:PREDICTED: condensin complex subunit 2 [Nanorana parkeri]|uniref:condensin complex subunit 2 n=1 Tax=Nanorana parkeri TaxID=125878 RepID=UPI0008542D3A|nr:PREDICTED: condensin complex subunit 2 [Nanorana parkeri]
MNTSTPQSGGRQKPLSLVGEYLSPATRPQPISAAGTPTLQNFTSNDDEWERKQRRRSRVIDLQLSNADSPASSISPAQRSEANSLLLPKLSNAQISDHYSTCIKLSQENRITTKNAFGLHLIDYMGDILKEKGSELTNFKVAAGTLDASAKIYAVRVDAVHADVYKVLGGLGKESQGSEQAAEVQDAGDAGKEPQNMKRKKRQHSVDTIEQNLNNISRSAIDRADQIDPLFQKAAASFDECSTVGVFLTTLHCSNYHSELHFDNYVIPLSTIQEEQDPTPTSVDTTELKALLDQCVEKRPLCPSLAKFRLMQLGGNVTEENLLSLTDKYKESNHAFDMNAEIEDDGPEPAGPEMDDFDADVCDGNEAEDLGEFAEQREACRAERKGSQVTQIADADIGTMCLQLSSRPGEYSYFSPRTMSMWAGPEHWRFRPRQKVEIVGDKQKIKKAKKVFELNFEEDINFQTHFCKTRAATTLAKSTLENQNKKATTLPADFHYDPDSIARMSLRPADRHYNNPNDTSNFCPALHLSDSDDDDGPFVGATDEGAEFPIQNGRDEKRVGFDGEHTLIAEPQKVNKIEIIYAKTAKKMDMKHLKTSMWGLLEKTPEKADEPNHTSDIEKPAIKEERIFSSVTRELQKRLPTVMAQNLSVPLAFACLLHLANEKNLKLQEVEDLSDVLIMQGD